MMDGIILAALALLSVPVLLVVILVKVCGLENKVADLTKKVGVIDFTRRNGAAENVVSRRDEMHRSRERSGCLSEANPEGAARGCETRRRGVWFLELGRAPDPLCREIARYSQARSLAPKYPSASSALSASLREINPPQSPTLRVSASPRELKTPRPHFTFAPTPPWP